MIDLTKATVTYKTREKVLSGVTWEEWHDPEVKFATPYGERVVRNYREFLNLLRSFDSNIIVVDSLVARLLKLWDVPPQFVILEKVDGKYVRINGGDS